MPTASEALYGAAVRHQIWLQRYGGSVANKAVALLNRADADLAGQLRDRLAKIGERGFDTGPATTRRLERLRDAVRVQSRDLYRAVGRELRSELTDLADSEVDIAARRINEAIGVDLGIVRPAPELLRAAVTAQPLRGKLLRDWVADLDAGRVRRVTEAVRLGIVEGQTVDQIVRRIRGSRANNFRDGLLDIDRRGAEALVRTAVNHVSTRARDLLYGANGDVIKGVRWVSTLDGRTTLICIGRDKQIYPVDSGPRPPAHIRCRSTISPVTRSWAELAGDGALRRGRGAGDIDALFSRRLKAAGFAPDEIASIKRGRRAAMPSEPFPDGTPADMSYGDWLARQPVAFQDDVLGAARGRLFRDGQLAADRFVDLSSGRPFTLDELRRRESEAWARASLADER